METDILLSKLHPVGEGMGYQKGQARFFVKSVGVRMAGVIRPGVGGKNLLLQPTVSPSVFFAEMAFRLSSAHLSFNIFYSIGILQV